MYYWNAAESWLKENIVVKQHLDSYNEFVNFKIQRIIDEAKEIETDREGCFVRFHKVRFEKPVVTEADGSKRPVFPVEARLRNKTYAAPIFLEMSLIDDKGERDREEIHIGDLPVMLKSDLCHLKGLNREDLIKTREDPDEPGGYFIVNGSERVLVSVEDLAPNRLIVSTEQKGGRSLVVARIFSVQGGFRAKLVVERNKDGMIYISFPTSPKNLNLFIVLKALGIETKTEILEVFAKKPEIVNDVLLNLESIDIGNRNEALDYVGKRVAAGQPVQYRKARAEHILDNYLLPHVGITKDERMKKAFFLARLVERCTEVAYGKRNEDDKDHYANKRIKISGNLMEDLFRYAFSAFIKDVKYQVERADTRGRKLQIRTLVRPDALSEKIRFAMATGTWVGGRQGISQLLDRITYMSTISYLRRVISPLSKTQPHFEARDLHPTHFGKNCTHETPEGQSCGLVKNLSVGCVISSHETEGLEKNLADLGVKLIKK